MRSWSVSRCGTAFVFTWITIENSTPTPHFHCMVRNASSLSATCSTPFFQPVTTFVKYGGQIFIYPNSHQFCKIYHVQVSANVPLVKAVFKDQFRTAQSIIIVFHGDRGARAYNRGLGRSPQRASRAEPSVGWSLVWGRNPLSWRPFCFFRVQRMPQICSVTDIWQIH